MTTVSRLLADLEHTKGEGHAFHDEENSLGARCLGAPVFDVAGNVVAAPSASGTLIQVDEASMPGEGNPAAHLAPVAKKQRRWAFLIRRRRGSARGREMNSVAKSQVRFFELAATTRLFLTENTLGT